MIYVGDWFPKTKLYWGLVAGVISIQFFLNVWIVLTLQGSSATVGAT